MKPILFNTEMVRAILEDRKTVTRRMVKPQPKGRLIPELPNSCWPGYFGEEGTPRVVRPPYFIGDILYVRETWNGLPANERAGIPAEYWYKADEPEDADTGVLRDRWHPSIHMPKEAARLFLRVKSVRVERLKEIHERGPRSAEQEGFINDIDLFGGTGASAVKHFADLWDKTINPTGRDIFGWEANPWVWVIEFERISKEEAMERMKGEGEHG